MTTDSSDISERLAEVIDRHKDMDGPCLPTLLAIQDAFGHVPAEAVGAVAKALNLSRADVHGVLSFYHDLKTKPEGKHVVKLCRAESCQAMGCETVAAEVEKRLGVRTGETAADQSVTLEAVYCLGNCALSPAAMVDGKLLGRVTAEGIADTLAKEDGQ